MKFSFYPKRILFLFCIGFVWAGVSSFYFHLYIKDFYNTNLIKVASSLSQIIAKKVHTKVLSYFALANKVGKNLEPFSPKAHRTNKDLEDILTYAMNKTPEILSISVIRNQEKYPQSMPFSPFIVVTRTKNEEIILEEKPPEWITRDLSPFKLPSGLVFITSPIYDSENQVNTISLIRTLWNPTEEDQEPVGYVDIRIPLPYINQFLSETLGSVNGHIVIVSPLGDRIVGNQFLAGRNLYSEMPFLGPHQDYGNRSIGDQSYLLYKRPLQFFDASPVTYIYLFLPTTSFLYSQESLLLFLAINMLILFFMFTAFVIFLYWSLKQNRAQEQAYQDIEGEAEKDPLTDVYNRAKAQKYLESLQQEYNEKGISFCCILFDLDFFKLVNDEHGHDKGDYVLKRISYLLQLKIRTQDLLARIGGEEFLIILKDIPLEDAYKRAEVLRTLIASYEFTFMHRNLTLSLGCAYVPARELGNHLIHNIQNIIDTADKALYFSKNHGRNQTTLTLINPELLIN